MKKGLALLVVLAVVLGIWMGGVAFARGGYGGRMNMMCPGYGGNNGRMMGPGYGGYGGNMIVPGYGGYCRNAPGTYGETKAITEKEAKSILGNYVGTNPNLKVGKITDKDTYFEAEIRTKEDSLVAKLAIDKTTGWVRPLY
ncbi:MAG: hypothetical protein AB1401_13545 [Thermodesulfobacteriota bacterium]